MPRPPQPERQAELLVLMGRRLLAWSAASFFLVFLSVVVLSLVTPKGRLLVSSLNMFYIFPSLEVVLLVGWLFLAVMFAGVAVFNDLLLFTSATSALRKATRKVSNLLFAVLFGCSSGNLLHRIMQLRWATSTAAGGVDPLYTSPFGLNACVLSCILSSLGLLHQYERHGYRNITISHPSSAVQPLWELLLSAWEAASLLFRVFLITGLHKLRPNNVPPPDAGEISDCMAALDSLRIKARGFYPQLQRMSACVWGSVLALWLGRQVYWYLSSTPLDEQPLLLPLRLCAAAVDQIEHHFVRVHVLSFSLQSVTSKVRFMETGFLLGSFGVARHSIRAAMQALAAAATLLFSHTAPMNLWVALWQGTLAYLWVQAALGLAMRSLLAVLASPVRFFNVGLKSAGMLG